MAKCMSIMETRGLVTCLRPVRLQRTVTLPHTEIASKTLYVAIDTTCPSLKVISIGRVGLGGTGPLSSSFINVESRRKSVLSLLL